MADVPYIRGEDFRQLLAQEAEAVAQRRERAFDSPLALPPRDVQPPTAAADAVRWPLPDNLVGLALSGGGLRSAAFNLGFIQALSRCGLLRYVDYMCSVSGGGYVAGHVTAAASATEHFHDAAESRFGVDESERLLPREYRFRHLGEYLLNYASFLWRYIASTLATLLLFVSLLGLLACSMALIWRSHDHALVRAYRDVTGISELAGQLRINGEALAAFLPSMPLLYVFLLLALVRRIAYPRVAPAWLVDDGRPDPSFRSSPILFAVKHLSLLSIGCALLATFVPAVILQVIQEATSDTGEMIGMIIIGVVLAYFVARAWLLILRMFDGSAVHGALWIWLASLAVSAAVFMGNGVSAVAAGAEEYAVQSYWSWFYGISAVASLLPLVAAGQLARSGQHDAPRWKRRVFYLLIGAATVGLPIAFVHLASRENVSGYATHREPKLVADDILDWNAFLALVGPSPDRPLKFLHDEGAKKEFGDLYGAALAEQGADLRGVDSWDRYQRSPAVHPVAGTFHFLRMHVSTGENNVFQHLAQAAELQERRQRYLDEQINPRLFSASGPTSASVTVELIKALSPTQDKAAANDFVKQRAEKMREGEALLATWNRVTLQGRTTDAIQEMPFSAEERGVFHRQLLECLFPDVIRERQMVSTFIVPPEDQRYRRGWLVLWSGLLVLALLVDYNRWSPFYSYYRERLARYFVSLFGAAGPGQPLHAYQPWRNGGPLPLLLGSHFLFSRVQPASATNDPPGVGPACDSAQAADASKVHPWVFSPLYCGGPAAGYQRTERYCGQQLTLADAMAISGSALTPFLVDNIFFSALMAAFNLRIGQWLPRPAPNSTKTNVVARGYEIGWEIWQGCFSASQYPQQWKLTLCADGGFHDFFGLEELLLRRCRIILVSDAGCNNGHFEFGALADVIRMVRERHGIRILDLDNECPADLSSLRRQKDKNVQPMHHICLRIAYPPEEEGGETTHGLLIYAQMSLTGREPLDLQQFRNTHPDFPDEPITNQFFDAKQVESYRQLGYRVASVVGSQVRPIRSEGGSQRFAALADVGRGLVRGYLAERASCCSAGDKQRDERSAAGIDLFESSRLWCPEPPPIAVEDFVSAEISSFLVSGRTTPIAEPWLSRIGSQAEVQRAEALVEQGVKLLKVHRRLLGYPTRSPFLPGGRRVLIRALATAAILEQVQHSPPVAGLLERAPVPWHAWCAIAHLVFQELGVETVARCLVNLDGDGAADLRLDAYQRLEKLTAALKQANVAEIALLMTPPCEPPIKPPVKRPGKGTGPRQPTALDDGPAIGAGPRKARD